MSIDSSPALAGRTSLGPLRDLGVSTYVVVYATALPAAAVGGPSPPCVAATLVAVSFGLLAVRTSGVYSCC